MDYLDVTVTQVHDFMIFVWLKTLGLLTCFPCVFFCEKCIPQYMLEQSDVDLAGGGESILCMLGEFPDVASMVDLFSTVNPGFYYLRI